MFRSKPDQMICLQPSSCWRWLLVFYRTSGTTRVRLRSYLKGLFRKRLKEAGCSRFSVGVFGLGTWMKSFSVHLILTLALRHVGLEKSITVQSDSVCDCNMITRLYVCCHHLPSETHFCSFSACDAIRFKHQLQWCHGWVLSVLTTS